MDWSQLEWSELATALREVSWSAPRPPAEFFRAFGAPNGRSYMGRVKNNLYYYRTNYLIILVFSFLVCFIRNPLALAALGVCTLGLGLCNDPFAIALNDFLLHSLRKVAPRLVGRARAKAGSDGVVGLHKRKRLYIVVLPRSLVVAVLLMAGLLLVYLSHAVLTLAWAILLGVGLPLAHASFRLPNLKAKIASAREEFRAVWRGYQAELYNDHTHLH
ncbi:hypothetical protein HYH03_000604 [Edaphochlamys debaryana]|uniref:PRA1 family protein n=1 Tax=Edaphochlamys debaryana TaxID=47281 RepID=A0A835YFS7_9CHLO|nr:hypothetical protein HYH03_000604 [Edaphochlamys debaryana]|eukprot:KAG2502112.1 hypothetical protein HYH03_000604 [Edaphochlamys debaryana]